MLADRELQIQHLRMKLIARNTGTPRNQAPGNPPRSFHKYPPKVAAAVQSVAQVLDGSIPSDERFEDFMTRTKTQLLTALEILNQENFNIDLPPLESDDAEDSRSFYSPSVDYDNDSHAQSVISNGRGILNSNAGLSNKSICTSISSKDLGSKNPSVNSLRCSDEVVESKNITPHSLTQTALGSEFPDEFESIEMTVSKIPTPKSNSPYTPLKIEREIPEELSPSDVEAEMGDEFDEEGKDNSSLEKRHKRPQ